MTTHIYLLRHGEAVANVERYFNGYTDCELTQNGKVQAELAALRLRNIKFDAVYTSDLQRTVDTVKPFCELSGLPFERKPELREINGGDWEGLRWADLPNLYPEQYENWDNRPHLFEAPSGETMKNFSERSINAVNDIIKNHEGQSVLIVTHGTVIRVLMHYFYGMPWDNMQSVNWCDNAAVSHIKYENGKFSVIIDGDNSHLGDKGTIHKQGWASKADKKIENTVL